MLSNSQWGEVQRAFAEHGVIFFRDQALTPEQHLDFARRWAPIDVNRFFTPVAGYPEIAEVRKEPEQTTNIGGGWHTDHSYDQIPAMGSILLARELPEEGGDTLFANMYLAYETLSDGMKRLLDGVVAVNSSAKADVTKTREDRMRDGAREDAKKQYTAEHPVVRTHPETGRKALYINGGHTVRFKDMTEQESAPLLQFLLGHATRPEFTCRFRWDVGSIALWDNRCTQHNPINDYHGFRRVMHRVTLAGDRPS